jgi:hypothetical protein
VSPDQLTALTALAALLKSIGVLPLSMIVCFVILGPWVAMSASLAAIRKEQAQRDVDAKERFEAVVRMYENNAALAKGYEDLSSDLASIIHLNTQTQTQLYESIRSNQFCPNARKGGR